jgi:hypothetical protein
VKQSQVTSFCYYLYNHILLKKLDKTQHHDQNRKVNFPQKENVMKTSQRLKSNKPIIAPRTMKLLQDRLDELNMNPRELAMKMDKAYDHIRVIVKGEKFGSDLMLREIGRQLHLNEDTLMVAYREDRAEQAGHRIPPMEPLLVRLVSIFNSMTEEGKKQVVKFAEFNSGNDMIAVK